MGYDDLIGMKRQFGYGTSLLNVTAAGFLGDVTVNDEDGNTIATKPLVDGKAQIPVTASGALIVSCTGATPKVVNITTYGTYNVTLTDRVIYTVRIAKSNTAPLARCVYMDDAEGFSRAYMDYQTGEFNYGSWEDAFFMPRPCMLKTDGTIDYFLDPDDYTKKEDGTASDIANTAYDGNAMMAFPTAWLKFYDDGTYRYISVTNKAAAGYNCYAHHDHSGNVMPYTFMPIYNGSLVSGKLRSLSGQSCYTNGTAQNERSYAQANDGQGNSSIYDIETFADRMLLIALCTLISKSTDSQTAFGSGRCASGNANAISTGTMNTKGLFWGSNDQTSGVKVFGMENPWGNVWRRIVGLIASAAAVYVKMTFGTEDGSTASGFNLTGSGYISTGTTMGGTSGGYISACDTKEYGIIPKTASGSETTYECDGLWFSTSSGTYMALVGGCWGHAGWVGAWCVALSVAASSSDSNRGASLSCKPPVV